MLEHLQRAYDSAIERAIEYEEEQELELERLKNMAVAVERSSESVHEYRSFHDDEIVDNDEEIRHMEIQDHQ